MMGDREAFPDDGIFKVRPQSNRRVKQLTGGGGGGDEEHSRQSEQ